MTTSNLNCSFRKLSWGQFAVNLFIALCFVSIALVVSLLVVMNIGRGFDNGTKLKYTHKATGYTVYTTKDGATRMVLTKDAIAGLQAIKDQMRAPERIFGTVLRVEGNQVIIWNNAAEEQVILSHASTMIFVSSTEVGITAIEEGQNVIILGLPDEEDNLIAKTISIQ